jgi:hypothetical protein
LNLATAWDWRKNSKNRAKNREHETMTESAPCAITRHRAAALAVLCAVLLAGCGSSGSSSSTSSFTAPTASVSTPTQSDPTTSPTTSSTMADTSAAGAPSFVVQGTTQDGDKVRVEGRFGSPLRPSESDVDQTALGECPSPASDGRELVVRLDLTTTLESSFAGEVTLSTSPIAGPLVSFVMGFKEGARCEGGEQKNAEASFGSVQPGQSVNFTMWVVLPDAITPADPHPSEKALAAGLWLIGVPAPLVNGKGIGTPNKLSGSRVVRCRHEDFGIAGYEHYIAVVGDAPTTLHESECPTE